MSTNDFTDKYKEKIDSTIEIAKGDSTYQIALENGFEGTVEEWLKSLEGPQGEKGDPFTYKDFTQEQLEGLKGLQGEQGPQGEQGSMGPQGPQGPQGEQGEKGDPLTFEELTEEQKEIIKGWNEYVLEDIEKIKDTIKIIEKPQIVLKGENPQYLTFTTEYIELGAEIGNNEYGNMQLLEIDSSSVNMSVQGNYVVRYKAKNTFTNIEATIERTVIVTDYPPRIVSVSSKGVKSDIKNGDVFRAMTKVELEKGTATIRKNEGEETIFTSPTVLSDGIYVMKAVAEDGASTIVSFIIDSTPPELASKINRMNYAPVLINFTDIDDVYSATITDQDGNVIVIKDGDYINDAYIRGTGYTLTKNGIYNLQYADKYGNEDSTRFQITI